MPGARGLALAGFSASGGCVERRALWRGHPCAASGVRRVGCVPACPRGSVPAGVFGCWRTLGLFSFRKRGQWKACGSERLLLPQSGADRWVLGDGSCKAALSRSLGPQNEGPPSAPCSSLLSSPTGPFDTLSQCLWF